jgi:sugar lactone lactonase YvrE
VLRETDPPVVLDRLISLRFRVGTTQRSRLDQGGCVWFADAGSSACVQVAEGGEVKDRMATGQGPYAWTLGGNVGRTLFAMTSTFPSTERGFNPRSGRILAFEVDVPGTGSP